MKCLLKYNWVKLPRNLLPQGRGILGHWAKLASRAAFRKGVASYCGYQNEVVPGMWSGGIVGVKSIVGVRSKAKALDVLDLLQELGYLSYTLDSKTKKLSYQINDWVVKCSGEPCSCGAVYTTPGYGFLCLPRDITERLATRHYKFEEADAWLDLWCHTVWHDPNNLFSTLAPAVQLGRYGAILTLETLGLRWGWEKTKVWRFLKKHGDVFSLYRLPGSYGCLIFNCRYPTGIEVSLPAQGDVLRIFSRIRKTKEFTRINRTGRDLMNRLVAWYSHVIVKEEFPEGWQDGKESRVAVSAPITRAYISLCRNCNTRSDCGKAEVPVLYEDFRERPHFPFPVHSGTGANHHEQERQFPQQAGDTENIFALVSHWNWGQGGIFFSDFKNPGGQGEHRPDCISQYQFTDEKLSKARANAAVFPGYDC